MAQPCAAEDLDVRRAYLRLQLGIPAHFESLAGRQNVRLVDLSQAGAHLILEQPEPVREGVLRWLRFDTFGIVVWQNEEHVGLEFDRLLPLAYMVETRHRAPEVVREAVEAWVSGTLSDN